MPFLPLDSYDFMAFNSKFLC